MFAIPADAPQWDIYRVDDYKDFGRKWCSWARAVRTFEDNQSNGNGDTQTSSDGTTTLPTPVAGPSNSAKAKTRRRKAKSQNDMDLDDDEDDDEDEDELSSSDSSSDDDDDDDESSSGEKEKLGDEEEAENCLQSSILSGLCKLSTPTSQYERDRADTIARNRETLLKLVSGIPAEEMPFLRQPLAKSKGKGKGKTKKVQSRKPTPTRASVRLIKVRVSIIIFFVILKAITGSRECFSSASVK
jgi:hypothetical protein